MAIIFCRLWRWDLLPINGEMERRVWLEGGGAVGGVNTAGNALIIRTKPLVLGAVVTTKPEIRRTLINSSFNPQRFHSAMGRVGAGSPLWLAGWMVDRPRCSGEILSRSVVDDIRTAAPAIVGRAGAAGWGRETSPACSVRRRHTRPRPRKGRK